MQAAGVPIIPSSPGAVDNLEAARAICRDMGYPVMIKSSGGGGGRGIRICENQSMLAEEFPVARMEARAAFGNDQVYLEKYIRRPRHIEFQILADHHGHVIHLGERECTIQRRFQKLIEEAPSPRLTSELRGAMGKAAVAAARAVDYVNAGTVEFFAGYRGSFLFYRDQCPHPGGNIRSRN